MGKWAKSALRKAVYPKGAGGLVTPGSSWLADPMRAFFALSLRHLYAFTEYLQPETPGALLKRFTIQKTPGRTGTRNT
jgi:hypothetical protein